MAEVPKASIDAAPRAPTIVLLEIFIFFSSIGCRCLSGCSDDVHADPIVMPPQTKRTCPVTNPDLSEQKNDTASATSSGVPVRLTGTEAIIFSVRGSPGGLTLF